jgi:beta-galactosidase
LVGGTGAIWIRAGEQTGKARLTAHHRSLGMRHVEFEILPAAVERA